MAEDEGLTYKDAGVDIDEADRLVRRIAGLAKRTHGPEVLEGIGGFASLFSLAAAERMEEPVLVSGTDGVGTKLKIAFETDVHDTIGIDLVAMCVNDVVTTGATPLFFLDYFGTGRLRAETGAAVVQGVAEGCRRAGCALVGGETAELPGLYADGEYDLAGFCVGIVDRPKILDGRRTVRSGDVLVGLKSTGLHSNGFSLARKALLEKGAMALDRPPDGFDRPLKDLLLAPTAIYVEEVRALIGAGAKALAHVTGGGLLENLPRVMPEHLVAEIDRTTWKPPPVFDLIRTAGGVREAEMFRTFNMGVGLVAFVPDEAAALSACPGAIAIGRVRERDGEEEQVSLGL